MSFQDRILEKRQGNASPLNREQQTLPANENIEEAINQKFFGIENIRAFPCCLDLRLADGKSKALPYTYVAEIDYDSSEGIEIVTANKKIAITGRNLHLLYNYLTAFRVKYIQANIGNDITEENLLFIKEIRVEEM